MTGQASGQVMYKVCRHTNPPNYFTEMPCGMCPVMSHCCEGSIISPSTCVYMTHWLNMPSEDVGELF